MILTIIVFIFAIGLFVFFHELGHFIAAKKAGVKVEEFAFGFPPTICKKKVGETVYALNAIPIGGYVKLFGEDSDIKNTRSFSSKSIWSRFWIIFAGVLMNFIFAWVLFVIGYNIGMPTTSIAPENIKSKQIQSQLIISSTLNNSPAQKAGLAQGDTIIAIDNQKVISPTQLSETTKNKKGQTVSIEISRYGAIKNYQIKLDNSKTPLGIEYLEATKVKVGFFQSFYYGFLEVVGIFWMILLALGNLFKAIFTPASVSESVTGPIGIWFLFQTAVKLGWVYVIQLVALISVNLAIINFLPFPALDGGRFMFLLIELFRGGKKVNAKIEGIVHTIGFAILILLMILITYRDIVHNLLK